MPEMRYFVQWQIKYISNCDCKENPFTAEKIDFQKSFSV
jgi:hypothetical protein